jgi:hypothetical protein
VAEEEEEEEREEEKDRRQKKGNTVGIALNHFILSGKIFRANQVN